MPYVTQHPFGKFCWVELATTDPAAAQEFYGSLLSWDFDNQYEQGELIYSMIQLRDKHVAGILQLSPIQNETPLQAVWNPFICVENAHAAAEKCTSLGAQVLAGPEDIHDSGMRVSLKDPNGVSFSLWQPKALNGFQMMKEPNCYLWADRFAHDASTEAEFYKAAFGWDLEDVSSSDNSGYYMFSQPLGEGEDEWDLYLAGVLQLRSGQSSSQPHWNVYFQVDDLDSSLQRALDLGGKQLRPMVENAMGRLIGIQDPQGASFTIMQMADLPD